MAPTVKILELKGCADIRFTKINEKISCHHMESWEHRQRHNANDDLYAKSRDTITTKLILPTTYTDKNYYSPPNIECIYCENCSPWNIILIQ